MKKAGLSTMIIILLFFSCVKNPVIPVVSTTQPTQIEATSAVSGGTISDDGGVAIISKGVCWNTTDQPTIENSKTNETASPSTFISNLSQLCPATTYYVRAYATNSAGTGYGDALTFTTHGNKPVFTNINASTVTINSATLNSTVNPGYLSTTVTIEWGTSVAYGNLITPGQNLVTGSDPVNVSADLTGLAPGVKYHFRIKATNELGTTYSNDVTFITLGKIPQAATLTPDIRIENAVLKANINPNNLPTIVSFEWGGTANYGNTTIAENPLTGSDFIISTILITGLSAETTYHYRVTAVNELGTIVSEDKTFTTYAVSDADENYYHMVSIGTQKWMQENLKTTRYTNGDLIGTTNPQDKEILSENTPKYEWAPNGDPSNIAVYGRLYSWYTITDFRGVCPSGWHVPTDTEWNILTDFLTNNGYGVDGSGDDIAKAMASKTGWTTVPADGSISNDNTNNSSGFSALPGGYRLGGNTFTNIGYVCTWWTSSEYQATTSIYKELYFSVSKIHNGLTVKNASAFSVRCIKN